jgi:hypothetical protein
MKQQKQEMALTPFFQFPIPGSPYCAKQHVDAVRELTADWAEHCDLTQVFDLVAKAKSFGFKLVRDPAIPVQKQP